MKAAQHLPTSEHFRLEQWAAGGYAAIHIDGGMAISNAGNEWLFASFFPGNIQFLYQRRLRQRTGA